MIKTWKSDMERIYIPIICPHCNTKVSVRGSMGEDAIELESCPNCKAPGIICKLIETGSSEYLEEEITTEVFFYTKGELQTAHFKCGPYYDIIEAIASVVNGACLIFQTESAGALKFQYLLEELRNLPNNLKEYILSELKGENENEQNK